MTLLFGQHPQGSMADRQHPLHARVGSVGDVVTPKFAQARLLGGGGGDHYPRTYIRRDKIIDKPLKNDEDLVAALIAFALLENDTL